jgi:uncharacterized protein with von Willebrand factor type A (vWA) domain
VTALDPLSDKIQAFLVDLRLAGIPISVSQAEDCYRSLLLIDWSQEEIFYSALMCTLLKESALLPIFDEVYRRHFHSHPVRPSGTERVPEMLRELISEMIGRAGSGGEQGKEEEAQAIRPNSCAAEPPVKAPGVKPPKDPLSQNFYGLSYDELKRMESMVPLLAKRLASKMVMKKRKERAGQLDHRRTLRASMASGGVPVDLFVKKKTREKPVIFALCDVSLSCLQYSAFSLAMVYSLEKFFRQVRSFAFIEETDEVTSMLKDGPYMDFRRRILTEAGVTGETGRTDYGQSLTTFVAKYGKDLSHKSQVLIFGDARTNWFPTRPQVLKTIQDRVKRVYWFNPEPKAEWYTGDSSMKTYEKYCDRIFECSNLEQLAQAICEI